MSLPVTQRRAGYTLLELVIAAGLSTLVMAAITGLILVAYRVQSLTVQEMQLTQVAHQLLQQFTRDFQSLPAVQKPETESSTDTQSQLLVVVVDLESGIVSRTTEEPVAPTFWLTGSATYCEFLISQYALPGRAVVSEQGSPFDLPRQRLIRWGVADETTNTVDANAGEQTGTTGSLAIRSEYLANADLTELLLADSLTVPEVQSIQFSYFDGSSWVDSWDGESLEQLPRAIDIQLTLANSILESSADPAPTATHVKTVHKIIELPSGRFTAAEPVTESAAADG